MKAFWEKIDEMLLILLLLLVPTQLGKHFWPEWSMVMGVRVDYLSPTLYLIDLVWLAWVMVKGMFLISKKRKIEFKTVVNFQNIIATLLVVLNIAIAGNRWVAVYRWLRVFQWVVTFGLIRGDKLLVVKQLLWIVPVWVLAETILGVSQVVKGGSIEGWWYWFGERRFGYSGIGVAQISWLGQGVVRAYGTFSHPNSMAGFFLLVLAWWNGQKKVEKITWWWVFWMLIVGIIVCGSRVVWLMAGAMVVWRFWIASGMKFGKKILGYGAILLGLVLIVMGVVGMNYRLSDFVGGWDSDSSMKRMTLNWSAMKMWKDNFILGVGLGNFTSRLPYFVQGLSFYWWQPVHNIFLLLASETGILGVMGMVWVVASWWRNRLWKEWKILLICLIFTGMLDHYWVTLPQNNWLLAVILAVL
ncbi:O-antigen ligase family protein [Candidatus Shapirobacteria bacterium]|nr:O-antigen ligase family protein [Candidatus Shapirobacteria bacterium]